MGNLQSISSCKFRIKKRNTRDRRNDYAHSDFPIKTIAGYLVYRDRRTKPERRLKNIRVSELVIRKSDFMRIFKRYQ